jgi:myosin protein heavy chain
MSLSDLPVPSDVSEVQNLEQDLEQALVDEHYPPEETGTVHSVTGSEEPQEEPSPTFSSEEPTALPHFPSRTTYASTNRTDSQSPQALSVAQSSPAPSVMFTPTPAFPPRPRPRFFAPGLPSTPAVATDHSEPDNNDLVTPYARRRSFLIDVINSTARPRFAQPTPHPPRAAHSIAPDDEDGDSMSPGSSGQSSSKKSTTAASDITVRPLNGAFAGYTPASRQRTRPMGRLSHPLSRGWTAPGSESEEAGGGASFTSTGSSHDLTAHPRANASFDQVIGLGAGGHGIGRFNAGKLNTYLHGLNRRLQEESD